MWNVRKIEMFKFQIFAALFAVVVTGSFLTASAAPFRTPQKLNIVSPAPLFGVLRNGNIERLVPPVDTPMYYMQGDTMPSGGMARLPSLSDVIQIVPFLPIEINVPDMMVGMYGFLSWLVNRGQENGTPRIYFIVEVPNPPPILINKTMQ
ncbi:hypothetical protein C0J52_24406 [Blattella germanica]|nr:hypothetical protein C0J52_24406 [Blattella germanica]